MTVGLRDPQRKKSYSVPTTSSWSTCRSVCCLGAVEYFASQYQADAIYPHEVQPPVAIDPAKDAVDGNDLGDVDTALEDLSAFEDWD